MEDEGEVWIADRLGVGLLQINDEGDIVAANEAAHELLAARSGSLIGKSPMEAFVDHRVEAAVMAATSDEDLLAEVTTPTEPIRTVIVRARRSPEGISVLLEDVSELRRLRRIRTEFIDNLAHELRTPLTTMRLLAEAMTMEVERTEVPDRVREYATKIDDETGHLAQMVSELLDLSHIEQGEVPLQLSRLDVLDLVELNTRAPAAVRLAAWSDAADRRGRQF